MEKDIKVGDVRQGGGEVMVGVFVEKSCLCGSWSYWNSLKIVY